MQHAGHAQPAHAHPGFPVPPCPALSAQPQHPRLSEDAAALPSLLLLVTPWVTRSVMEGWVSKVSCWRALVALGGEAARGLPPLSLLMPASGGTRMAAGGGGSDDMPARLGELKAAGGRER